MDTERAERFWNAFKNIAIVFSFAVNFIVVIVFLVLVLPTFRGFARPPFAGPPILVIKSGIAEPVLDNLDAAFVGLGESTISTTIDIDQQMPIAFSLPLDQQLPLDFQLPIDQDATVILREDVPLYLPAQFNLPGGGGVINGTVSLALPAGLVLPVRVSMSVPVAQTIPVRMDVPVNQTIPIQMDVPVRIKLGEAGLAPAVEELRNVFRPLRLQLERLPDDPFGGD